MTRMTIAEIQARADELARHAETVDPADLVESTTPEMLARRRAWIDAIGAECDERYRDVLDKLADS